jgi:hypothetical protein
MEGEHGCSLLSLLVLRTHSRPQNVEFGPVPSCDKLISDFPHRPQRVYMSVHYIMQNPVIEPIFLSSIFLGVYKVFYSLLPLVLYPKIYVKNCMFA